MAAPIDITLSFFDLIKHFRLHSLFSVNIPKRASRIRNHYCLSDSKSDEIIAEPQKFPYHFWMGTVRLPFIDLGISTFFVLIVNNN